MSVNNEISTTGPFAGNGTTTAFSLTFTIRNKNQAAVFLTNAAGVMTEQVVDVNYNMTGFPSAGTVVMNVAPASGESLFIVSDYIADQLTELSSQGGFFPDTHENVFDKLTYLILQLQRRALLTPQGAAGGLSLPAARENYGIKYNAAGQLVEENMANNLKNDGSNAMAANLGMGGFTVKNAGAPTELDDLVRVRDLNIIDNGSDGLVIVTGTDPVVLAAGQTTVVFTLLTTVQAALYISGDDVDIGRLRQGLDFTITNTTTIELTSTYPVGTVITLLQNEVSAGIDFPVKHYDNVAAMKAANLLVGTRVKLDRYYADGALVADLQYVISSGTADGYVDHTMLNGNIAKLIFEDELTFAQIGITSSTVDSKASVETALALADVVVAPSGTFAFSTLNIVDSQKLRGQGRTKTTFTFSDTSTRSGVPYSIGSIGGASPALTDIVSMSGFTCDFAGATGGVGLLVTKKTFAFDCYYLNADLDGIYFRSIAQNTEASYFSEFESCWSKFNGESGLKVTDNSNANRFVNCLFDSNTLHGVHFVLLGTDQPQALYSSSFYGGQTSFNQRHGVFFESGSEYTMHNVYQEFNSQIDGGNPKTGVYKNTQLGSTVSRCHIVLGSQGTSTDIETAIGLNTVTSNFVYIGNLNFGADDELKLGYQNVGAGRNINFNGAGGAIHNINFNEGADSIFRVRYNGTPANPTNEFLLQAQSGGVWSTLFKMTNNGRLSFFDADTVAKPTVAGVKDGGTALTSLIASLVSLGLITDSTT